MPQKPVLALTTMQQENRKVCTIIETDGICILLVLHPNVSTPNMYYASGLFEANNLMKGMGMTNQQHYISPYEMSDETSARRVNTAREFIEEIEALIADDGGDRD